MKKWIACLAMVIVGGVIETIAQKPSVDSPLVGVWRISERTFTGPNARTITNLQPGIIIITPHYYSNVVVTSETPRTELPEQPTDKQRLDAFGPFGADAGTYEIKGNEITSHPVVHKNPNRMRAGSFEVDTFRMEGRNTLWLTPRTRDTGPVANPTTTTLTRLE